MIKKLTEMDTDETAMIVSFDESMLSGIFINDLLDYGFLPGSMVKMLNKSSSQNKLIISIGMAEIALRENDARFIKVKAQI